MYTHIVIRSKTRDALRALVRRARESQEGASPSLSPSDVIDTLIEIASETQPEEEVLEAIVVTAERN